MKVTVCPICRVTPDFTNTEVKCPKCGRRAVGKDLTETLTKWNNGVVETAKAEEPVKEEVKPVKKEVKPEVKAEEPKKMPVKTAKKPVKEKK